MLVSGVHVPPMVAPDPTHVSSPDSAVAMVALAIAMSKNDATKKLKRDFLADNDRNGAGERAAIKAARRFQREGRRTRLVTAEAGDFNDMLMK